MVYKLLDIIATISEAAALFLLVECFCKCKRNKIFHVIPWIAFFLFTYFITWYPFEGEYKAIAVTIFNIAVIFFCYQDSLINICIAAMLAEIIIVIPEPITFLMSGFFFHKTYTLMDGQLLVYWPVYLVVIAVRGLFCFVSWYMMRNFVYKLKVWDLTAVFIDFVIMQIIHVSFYSKFFEGNPEYGNRSLEVLMAVAGISFLIHFLYTKNYYAVKSGKERDEFLIRQYQKQYMYYREKLEEEERVRRIYHDMKNHLLLLEKQTGGAQQAGEAIQELQAQMADYENYYHTGNDFLDVIIRDKAKTAREKQTDFMAGIQFTDAAFIEPLDISTIFGNALDNALEAGEYLKPEERLITVKAGRVRDMISILFENNMAQSKDTGAKTTKKDKLLHGYGIANIEKAVEKYAGQCTIRRENGRFTMKIIIPITQPKGAAVK